MKTNQSSVSRASLQFPRIVILALLSTIVFISESYAQFSVGVGFGSENLHVGPTPRKFAPNLDLQYIASNMRVVFYLDATTFGNKVNKSTSFVDEQGDVVHYDENYKSTHVLTHLGFKALFADADKKAPIFFAGGGLVGGISQHHQSANGTDPNYPFSAESKEVTYSFGIGLLAGVQYYLKPVILQLRGDLDFSPLPVVGYAENSVIHTNTRFSILIPLKQL